MNLLGTYVCVTFANKLCIYIFDGYRILVAFINDRDIDDFQYSDCLVTKSVCVVSVVVRWA